MLTENILTNQQKMAEFIPFWLETRPVLNRHNTIPELQRIIAIEHTELIGAINEFGERGYDSAEILEEGVDLIIFALQLLYKLGAHLPDHVEAPLTTLPVDVDQALRELNEKKQKVISFPNLEKQQTTAIQEVEKFLLSIRAFFEVLKLCPWEISLIKADYILEAMPPVFWTGDHNFADGRKANKEYIQANYPKELFLHPHLQRAIMRNSARRD